MYYAFYCLDAPNSLEKRRSVREAHLHRLRDLAAESRLLLVGPLLNHVDEQAEPDLNAPAKGSLIVAAFDTLADAKAWAAADPYATAGVYGNVFVEPFKPISL